jgi:murein DD-endopeptidase MepM/ murein hydrolase activator NlpD
LKRHLHIISMALMLVAFFTAAREYYVGYQLQSSLNSEIEKLLASQAEPQPLPEETPEKLDFDVEAKLKEKSDALSLFEKAKTVPITDEKIFYVEKGQTLASILSSLNVTAKNIQDSARTLKKYFRLNDFKIGQALWIKTSKDPDSSGALLDSLKIKPSPEEEIIVTRSDKGFIAEKKTIPLTKNLRRIAGSVESGFYKTALRLNVPPKIAKEAIAALAYIVNMQHGLKRGDPFEILYEEFKNQEGDLIKTGSVLYVSLTAGGKLQQLYRYAFNGKNFSYYNQKGECIQRGLLQTPIDPRKMRVTSHFQKGRMHPLKGYRRDHQGVDFGAPTGTTVMAAADGVVVKAGYFGDYGKYIRIQHTAGYQTAYAHLSKISDTIRVGAYVRQRDPIGAVGSTGLATGPHLHYEVIHNNIHVNPLHVKHMPATNLKGKDLDRFNQFRNDLHRSMPKE